MDFHQPTPITLTPLQVMALARYGASNPIRVGHPMFLVKPDFGPLDPDVSLKMEWGNVWTSSSS